MKRELEDLKAVNRRVVATLARLEGKIDDMSERMATKDDLAAFKSDVYGKLDAFAAGLEDGKERAAIQSSLLKETNARLDGVDARLDGIDGRLDGIDGRLGRLEERL